MDKEISNSLFEKVKDMELYECSMEYNFELNCYSSFTPSGTGNSRQEILDFYNENHFAIGWNFFDPEWSNEIQAEEIFKRIILIYDFNPNDENILIVRGPKIIFFKNKTFAKIPEKSIFIFDKTKVKIDYEESE